ncbi:glycerate kinase [Loigolactobacillus zhaoyuanensis]|uniref:glycerate kinase n=1 Tax=Loigolactobacillus zhaoyuanensis TaxID=2486017 RepID=UPI000F74682F|nr:glycerate kinase [Loigolactobacillus zhaoyuanensis]
MNRVLIASDSFKGSATSTEIAKYITTGILRADETAQIDAVSIADGGEGTVCSVVAATGGRLLETEVAGPLGTPVKATWGLLDDQTAIIEVAESSGITLIQDQLDAGKTTTFGVGQLIKAALDQQVTKIYVGLGGSATNDGGVGMAQALGGHFYDHAGQELPHGANALCDLEKIDLTTIDPRLKTVKVIGLSDVNNPLTGEEGASQVFGPQKGASQKQVAELDRNLQCLARIVEQTSNVDYATQAGAGAAGGTGFGLMAFCQAEIKSGINEIINLLQLDQRMQNVDLVITGEGQIDGQSLHGKLPVGVAHLAKQHDLPVIAIVGSIGHDLEEIYKAGFNLVLASTSRPMTLQQATKDIALLVADAGYTAFKAFESFRQES